MQEVRVYEGLTKGFERSSRPPRRNLQKSLSFQWRGVQTLRTARPLSLRARLSSPDLRHDEQIPVRSCSFRQFGKNAELKRPEPELSCSIYDAIGKGKHSKVFKGREKKTIQYYAIKSVDKSERARVLQEVTCWAACCHQVDCTSLVILSCSALRNMKCAGSACQFLRMQLSSNIHRLPCAGQDDACIGPSHHPEIPCLVS